MSNITEEVSGNNQPSERDKESMSKPTKPDLPCCGETIREDGGIDNVGKLIQTHALHGDEQLLLHTKLYDNVAKKIKEYNLSFSEAENLDIKEMSEDQFISFLTQFNGETVKLFNNYFIITDSGIFYITWTPKQNSNKIFFSIYTSSYDDLKNNKEKIYNIFKSVLDNEKIFVDIDWFCMTNGKLNSFSFTENLDDVIYQEAYPYIENIEGLIQNYIDSVDPLLLFIGKPGTGKTRLIRYILKKMALRTPKIRQSGIFTTDREVVESTYLYTSFLSNRSYSFLIIEDMDYHLQSRSDGNFSMYNLLTISDGLLKNSGKKKIILSTNLPNTKNIDDALLRSGRCFGTINSRLLSLEESGLLMKKLNCSTDLCETDKAKFNKTLADLYKIAR